MAVSRNQKIGELARIAYLALLHAESELGEETNTLDGDKLAGNLRDIRLAILGMFSDTENKVNLDKAIYLIGNDGSLGEPSRLGRQQGAGRKALGRCGRRLRQVPPPETEFGGLGAARPLPEGERKHRRGGSGLPQGHGARSGKSGHEFRLL